jgi:hypothetical protein
MHSDQPLGGFRQEVVDHTSQHWTQRHGRLWCRGRLSLQVLLHQPDHSDSSIGLFQGGGNSVVLLSCYVFDGEFK